MMHRTRLAALTAAVCLGFAAGALAQSTPAPKPATGAAAKAPKTMTAEQVLDKSVEAIGGRAALEKHTTFVMKGTMEAVGLNIKGPIEVYAKAPNKMLAVSELPGVGTSKQGYSGTVGWSNDPLSGSRELSGVELAQLKRAATFGAESQWRKLYKSAELTGTEQVGGRNTYVVKLTPAEGEGSPVLNYYDAETFLLLRSDSVQESPMGTIPVTTITSDYREIGGVKMPFVMEQQLATMTIRTTFAEMTFDVPLEDAKFDKPK
jgi:zinc protease